MQKHNVNLPIIVTARHMDVTDAIREYAHKKIESLHLDYPRIIQAKVILEVQNHHRHIAEILLFCADHIIIEAKSVNEDIYASIDESTAKIARRMRKYKTRPLRTRFESPRGNARIRISFVKTPRVSEFLDVLGTVHRAYVNLAYFFDAEPSDLVTLPDLDTTSDTAIVGLVEFHSPGFWEMIGDWNPIKLIVDYLKFSSQLREKKLTDDHKRRKLELENMLLEDQVFSSRVRTLRETGVPEEVVQQMLSHYVSSHLDRLADFESKELISAPTSQRGL